MKTKLKGILRRYYFVTCGKCSKEESLGTTEPANVDFHLKRGGWIKTQAHGYVCERCQKVNA